MHPQPSFPRTLPVLSGALLAGLMFLAAPSAEAADNANDPKWCRACHNEPVFSADQMGKSVHADLTCRDCHQTFHFNPHEPVKAADESDYEGVLPFKPADPVALAACSECHYEVAEEAGKLPHGKNPDDPNRPYCLQCHGNPHVIVSAAKMSPIERREAMNARCEKCHGDAELMAKSGLTTEPVESYEESIHSKKLELGSEKAPGCADCHGGHKQTDWKTAGTEACGKCHEGANESFVSLGSHLPVAKDVRPVAYYTQKVFAWLTFITIFLLAFHVLLDLNATIRNASRKNRGKKG